MIEKARAILSKHECNELGAIKYIKDSLLEKTFKKAMSEIGPDRYAKIRWRTVMEEDPLRDELTITAEVEHEPLILEPGYMIPVKDYRKVCKELNKTAAMLDSAELVINTQFRKRDLIRALLTGKRSMKERYEAREKQMDLSV